MPLPLIPILIAAGVGILGTGTGVAISNWTNPPDYDFTGAEDITLDIPQQSAGIAIDNKTLLIAGAALVAIMLMKK